MIGKVGVILQNDFTIINANQVRVSGVNPNTISAHLFDPDGNEVTSLISVLITELGFGHYRSAFTPNKIGTWYMVVYHSIYFPYGKGGNCQIFANDFDTIEATLSRILGLVQENFSIDNIINDTDGNMLSGRIRIYSDSISVGSDSNVISAYNVDASYTDGLMDSYKVIKE